MRSHYVVAPKMYLPRTLLLFCAPLFCASAMLLHAVEPLTSAAAARTLPTSAAAEGRPVQLSGVVTYLRLTDKDFNFNLHDASGGVMVYPIERAPVQPGQFVTVTGVTAMSVHGLRIANARVTPGEIRGLPSPQPSTMGDVLDGKHEGDFVELEGTVRVVRLEAPEIHPRRLAIDFGSIRRRLTAWVTHYDAQNIPIAPGAKVKIRGVALRWTNPRGQPQSTSLLVNSLADASFLAAAGEPPQASIRDLLLWNGVQSDATRIRTAGIVTFHQAGELTVVQEDGFAIRIRSADTTALPAFAPADFRTGDRIEAVGFPALGEYTVELEDARLSRIGPGQLPAPEILPNPAAVLSGKTLVDRDARLISVPAMLRHIRERDGRLALEMDSSKTTFTAWLPPDAPLPDAIRPGAELQLTGICTLHLGEAQRRIGRGPDHFSLLLDNANSIRVLRGAPWWNAAHLLLALGIAAAIAVLLALWAWMLRKKNRLLREEIHARERAEKELSGERRRVAGELHDTLEQTLVATALQLNAASRTLTAQPAVAAAQVSLAQQLVARSRQEVRDAVWDLRLGETQQAPLSALLARLCAETSASAIVSFSLESLEPPIPGHITAQAIRLVREAVANALKHAAPRHVRVEMRVDETHLHLTVTDDGCGLDRASAPGPDTGHFGLAGMEERVQRLGGVLRTTSMPGQGTTFYFEIPLSA